MTVWREVADKLYEALKGARLHDEEQWAEAVAAMDLYDEQAGVPSAGTERFPVVKCPKCANPIDTQVCYCEDCGYTFSVEVPESSDSAQVAPAKAEGRATRETAEPEASGEVTEASVDAGADPRFNLLKGPVKFNWDPEDADEVPSRTLVASDDVGADDRQKLMEFFAGCRGTGPTSGRFVAIWMDDAWLADRVLEVLTPAPGGTADAQEYIERGYVLGYTHAINGQKPWTQLKDQLPAPSAGDTP